MIPHVVVIDDYTYTTAEWPLWLTVAGLAIAMVLVNVAVGLALGRVSGLGRPWWALNGLLGVGAACVVVAAAPLFAGGAHGAADVFRSLYLAEAFGAAGIVGLLGIAAAIWVGAPKAGGPPWPALAGVVPALGIVAFAVAHAGWLRAVRLPELTSDLPDRVHVGRPVTATVTMDGVGPGEWDAPPVRVSAGMPGTTGVTLTASRIGMTVERTVATLAGEDRMDRAVAIHVGDRWELLPTTSWHDHYLWFVSSPGSATGERLTLAITGDREERGLHVYDLVTTDTEGAHPAVAYAWDGAVLLKEDTPGEPRALLRVTDPTADADGTVACDVGAFDAAGCRCFVAPPGPPLALAGPARCAWTTSNPVATGVSVFLAIATIGLVIEDPDRSHYLEVVASSGGG